MSTQRIEIPVFYGSYSDLTKLDISFINARIVVYKGTHFRTAFKDFIAPIDFNHSYGFATNRTDETDFIVDKHVKLYAIIPIDTTKPFKDEDIFHFYELLLAIFPSDLSIVKTISLIPSGNKFQCGSVSQNPFKSTGDSYFDNFLYIYKTEYKFIRNFIKTHFANSKKLSYVKYIMSIYTNSFFEHNPIYQFISLMICLEVIVEGKEQLTYKIKRNVAILCGKNVDSCRITYKNIDQLYKLRSAIVHGEIKPSYKNFKEYHQYLKKLVARLIRELVVHNISTVKELNEKLTEIGYSQNHLLSNGYIYSKYPIMDNMQLSYKAIQKY
jgi:hypothetical protein